MSNAMTASGRTWAPTCSDWCDRFGRPGEHEVDEAGNVLHRQSVGGSRSDGDCCRFS